MEALEKRIKELEEQLELLNNAFTAFVFKVGEYIADIADIIKGFVGDDFEL